MLDASCSTVAQRSTDYRVNHGLLLLALMCVPALVPGWNRWPVAQFVPVLCYAALVLGIPSLRYSAGWWRVGRLEPRHVAATVALALASAAALVAWKHLAQPDLHRFAARVPHGSLAVVVAAGLGFAVVNATAEEAGWRGVILDALESRIGRVGAVLGQGVFFGAGHYAGIPGGIVGMALASAFGIALGLLRKTDNGLLLCITAHIVADVTIFTLVASSRP